MGAWSSDSKSHVSSMDSGDFYGSEVSATIEKAGTLAIKFVSAAGSTTTLKESVPVLEGEIVDASVMHIVLALEEY